MPRLQTMTDDLPRDDPRARFERLSREHGERLQRFVRLKLGAELRGRLDSQDVVQEVLLEAFQRYLALPADAEPEGEAFLRWLAPIVTHRIQSLARFHLGAERRSLRREEDMDPVGGPDALAGLGRTPSGEVSAAEEAQRLRDAIARLTPREREVITLVHFEKLRVREAAQRMGKTPNATSVLLHEALSKLRRFLGERES